MPNDLAAPLGARDRTTSELAALGLGADAVESGRLLFAQPCNFLLGVVQLAQLPDADLAEIAFAGRSNVGKSSLVNALTGRTTLARTSNTPGRTQEINLFLLGGRLRLVDLPGYGFAKAPKAKVEAWTDLVFDYLRGRPNLRLVCLLLDARHPAKTSDTDTMAELARAAVPFLVVVTKADLVRPKELDARLAELDRLLRGRPAALPVPLVTSSRERRGIDQLRALLASFTAQDPAA